MDVSFGFVSICLSEHQCSPAGQVTVKSVADLDEKARIARIKRVAIRNIENTIRITHFLHAHDICLYRMSAGLIPLATHDLTRDWHWWEDEDIQPLLVRLGKQVRKHNYRFSSHLPEVCVLSTPEPDVFQWMERYVRYHRRLFEVMAIQDTAVIVIHIGGAYGDAEQALKQAEKNFATLDPWARSRLVLENDDKVFSARQTVGLAKRLGIPMVFDYHHHVIRNDGESLERLLSESFETWSERRPKVHLSSPRSTGNKRAHADYVDWDFALPFMNSLRSQGVSVDIMIEAKMKDLALFQFRERYMSEYILLDS